ncbi:hypothetical protein K461DRAFT_310025 [Myriangium duriaei CBS 260.36]|uniref:Uncharacterized protein n=1 Tax=Myriangium duriaei CBS 260.36 TaxID=1168546 RepID=A0A9P4MM93_9PEZI|nr:hypothetical protein K461DRAFT_310025 [Myriangium duriaei CBS 260.36]
MDSTHRKIELQSPADLQHIVSGASRAARAKIDLHFPPRPAATATDADAPDQPPLESGGDDDDPLRKRVEALVQEFLERTFSGVRGNVSVNGMEGAEMERELGEVGGVGEETEPFDHLLARRVQNVSSQIEALTLQLASMRRDVPGRTAESYTKTLDGEEERWRVEMERGLEGDLRRVGEVELRVEGLEDVEGMRRSWDDGTRRLVEVKEGVGGVQARLERAREAVAYLASA